MNEVEVVNTGGTVLLCTLSFYFDSSLYHTKLETYAYERPSKWNCYA